MAETDGLFEPEPGNRIVAAELTVANPTGESTTFSTLLLIELIDSMDRAWNVSIFGVSNRPSLDGDVPAGESRRGWVGFEVPTDATGFRLRVKGSITADGATFELGCQSAANAVNPAAAVPTSAPEPPDGGHGVGSTDTTADLAVTLHAFEDPVGDTDGLLEPAQGNRVVAAELTLQNTSTETQTFSTLLLVELIDSQNRAWQVSIFGVSDRPSLDGDVPPGEARRGWVAFEVPADATGFRLHVKGSITADGTTFVIG